MKIFFGKISMKVNTAQIEEGYYESPKNSSWFNGINIGDYAFVIGGNRIQLWKAKAWSKMQNNDNDRLNFEILIPNINIWIDKFVAFKYFELNMDLIVKTTRSTAIEKKAFFEITVEPAFTETMLLDSATYQNEQYFRKIKVLEANKIVATNSYDIQLQFNQSNILKLHPIQHSDQEILLRFKDNTGYIGTGQKRKDKTLAAIKKRNTTALQTKISIKDIYDAFLCDYKSKKKDVEVDNDVVTVLNKTENTLSKMVKESIQLLNHKPQIILQGPPGTGKTYEAKNIAESLIREDGKISDDKKAQADFLKKSDQFELIQFHPSYTYEDFVRGIVAKETGSYKVENKILVQFANNAKENFDNSKKTEKIISEEVKIKSDFDNFCQEIEKEIDENGKYKITEKAHILEVDYDNDGFRYDGANWNTSTPYIMKFDDILKLYVNKIASQKKVETCQFVSGTARRRPKYYFTILNRFKDSITDNSLPKIDDSLRKRKNYILIIDEINRANLPSVLGELIYALEYRNEAVESMYEKDGSRKIILPPNLYIIGTMNTADRSVGHIDYAIRRRFAFVDMLPKLEVIQTEKGKALFKAVEQLFKEHLSSDFQKNDVQLGHSYFLGEEDKLEMRLKYEIKPILMEYLKDGIFVEGAKVEIEKLTV